jgi:hypothetical protein
LNLVLIRTSDLVGMDRNTSADPEPTHDPSNRAGSCAAPDHYRVEFDSVGVNPAAASCW